MTSAARFLLKDGLSVALGAGLRCQDVQTLRLGDHDGVVLGRLLVLEDPAHLLVLVSVRIVFLTGDLLTVDELTGIEFKLLYCLFIFPFV